MPECLCWMLSVTQPRWSRQESSRRCLGWVKAWVCVERSIWSLFSRGAAGSCRECMCSAPSTGAGGNFRLRTSDFVNCVIFSGKTIWWHWTLHHVKFRGCNYDTWEWTCIAGAPGPQNSQKMDKHWRRKLPNTAILSCHYWHQTRRKSRFKSWKQFPVKTSHSSACGRHWSFPPAPPSAAWSFAYSDRGEGWWGNATIRRSQGTGDHKTIAAHRFNLLPLKSPWRWLGQSMRHNETSSWFISTCEGYMAWLERERERERVRECWVVEQQRKHPWNLRHGMHIKLWTDTLCFPHKPNEFHHFELLRFPQ